MVARDKAGNQAGTFPSVLTNISSRKNRTLKVMQPLIKNPPVVIFEKPQTGVTIPLGSSLRLVANASDPNGGLKGVQFYANQETVYSWSGILEFDDSDLPDDGDLLIFDDGSGRGTYTFEFDINLNVVSGDTPTLVPAYGNYLDDLSLSGGFNYPEALTFVIEIDGVLDGTDTYKWSTDGGNTFVEEKQKIVSGISQTLTHGLSIIFSNKTGHHQGDRWTFVAQLKIKLSIFRTRAFLRLMESVQSLVYLMQCRDFLS